MSLIKLVPDQLEVEVDSGTNLLEAVVEAGINLKAVCGGSGTCGKCQVIIEEGEAEVLDQGNLSSDKLERGYVLACKTEVKGDLIVKIPPESRLSKHQVFIEEEVDKREDILTEEELAATQKLKLDPIYRQIELELNQPSLTDNVSDLERLQIELNRDRDLSSLQASLPVMKDLASHLRENDCKTQVSLSKLGDNYEITELKSLDDPKVDYGLAVDIGTTTVVVELVDLATGKVAAREGSYNKQANYGDDVISRINFVKENEGGLAKLNQAVIGTMNSLIDEIVSQQGIEQSQIKTAVLAGNTTMIHLLLEIDPNNIRLEPYIPTVSFVPPLRAKELNLKIKEDGLIHCLPGVSSFVGGDISSGTLAAEIADRDGITLFIDIGTNGELVLGNKEWLMTCSCSAGPAFEGGGITYGMRAMSGAIEIFDIDPKTYEVKYSTIGDVPPIGICGSGLINLLALLKDVGIIGRSGKFDEELEHERLRDGEYDKEFVLVWADDAGIEEDIVISENDIKNLLRSKGAVYAGIRMMLNSMALTEEFIDQVLIAGGFGNYINLDDALKIGLLPDLPLDKFKFIGNTSLKGARMSLLSEDKFEEVQEIAKKMTYLELSAENYSQDFMDEFVSAQFIPHTDLNLFPSVTGK
ncbi:ASKHA domain-containing protein [Natroniella sulfidigena]|uniref:ASKHA domain-containing protein n=1 Tax=Natroniella sulfidigena TaxID=723921 RepID=UPI00200ACB0B|nr:ASKHA domain-containing protein [Natroniella sulfidigena]MCK8818208.1 ASKHA domain-containing protein [Natroniella sulfidigena]